MTLSEVLFIALQAAAPLLVAATTLAAARLATYIGSKVQNEYLRGALIRLDDAVLVAVKDLQQTVVDEIKAAAENGRLDEAARLRVKAAALANVKSYVGQKGFNVIADVLGLSNEMLDQFIRSRIEAAVHDLRVEERGSSSSVVVTNTPPDTLATPPVVPDAPPLLPTVPGTAPPLVLVTDPPSPAASPEATDPGAPAPDAAS